MAEQNMQYKLMVLYMLGKVDFSLTYAHLSDFILGRGYTDYFNLQQTIAELTEAGLIHQETLRSTTYYRLFLLQDQPGDTRGHRCVAAGKPPGHDQRCVDAGRLLPRYIGRL